MGRARVVGAYAAQPAGASERRAFIDSVLGLPGCDGLEIPFGSTEYERDRVWLWDALPPGGSHVLTLVAASMEALGRDSTWGPASGSAAGRDAALGLYARARDQAADVVAAGHRVVAVQVQSAPRPIGPAGASAEALRETLTTAAAWDWCGAALTIEHCDAHRAGEPFEKGFLSLADEVAVAAELRASGLPTEVGITINWGRSAIDARSAEGVNAQVRSAREGRVLLGLMLSGTVGADGAFGAAWADSHAPLHDEDPTLGEPTSLLTRERTRSALNAAGEGLRYDGLKIGVRPRDMPSERRLGFVRRLLEAM